MTLTQLRAEIMKLSVEVARTAYGEQHLAKTLPNVHRVLTRHIFKTCHVESWRYLAPQHVPAALRVISTIREGC